MMMIRHDRLNTGVGASAATKRGKGRRAAPAKSAGGGLDSLPQQLQDQAQQWMKDAGQLVAKYPEWSLLAAVSTGLIVGYLLKRK